MRYIFLLIPLLFFISCSNNETKKLKIATNSWIGYTPLFYAKEKKYLDAINIELISTVSLGESVDIFSVAKVDMLTGTEHEYHSLKSSFTTLTPIILIDRSDGGDMILSNRTISELQKSKKIVVYLEVDSINSEMIKDFIAKYKLDKKKIRYINKDQAKLQNVQYDLKKSDIIVVTYTPYNLKLELEGLHEIASTKNLSAILVTDSIYTTKEVLDANRERLTQLKAIIDKSIKEIESSPNEAYILTHKYLENISYKEFLDSMKMIKWINHPSDTLLNKLKATDFQEESLIR